MGSTTSEANMSHKAALLRRLREEHDALAETLRAMTPEQMTVPGVYADGNGEWTVKDILAHITWWEQSIFGWLGLPLAVPRSPLPGGDLTEDETNHAIFTGNKDRTLDDVLSSFEHSHERLVAALEDASEERLARPRANDPKPDGAPIWRLVPGNSYEHYQIHRESIRAWLSERGVGGASS